MRLLFRSVSESPVRWPRLCLACAPPPAVAPSAFPPPRDRPQPLPQDQPPTCGVPPRPLPCASVFRSFPCKAPPIGQVLPDACAPALADRTAAFQWSPAAQDRNSKRRWRHPIFPPPRLLRIQTGHGTTPRRHVDDVAPTYIGRGPHRANEMVSGNVMTACH